MGSSTFKNLTLPHCFSWDLLVVCLSQNEAISIDNIASEPFVWWFTAGWLSIKSYQSHLKTTWTLVDIRQTRERAWIKANCLTFGSITHMYCWSIDVAIPNGDKNMSWDWACIRPLWQIWSYVYNKQNLNDLKNEGRWHNLWS